MCVYICIYIFLHAMCVHIYMLQLYVIIKTTNILGICAIIKNNKNEIFWLCFTCSYCPVSPLIETLHSLIGSLKFILLFLKLQHWNSTVNLLNSLHFDKSYSQCVVLILFNQATSFDIVDHVPLLKTVQWVFWIPLSFSETFSSRAVIFNVMCAY